MSSRILIFIIILAFLITVKQMLINGMDKDGHFPLLDNTLKGYKILFKKIKERKENKKKK